MNSPARRTALVMLGSPDSAMGAAMAGPAIGMDLGTTYSAVAWINADGEPEVIPDDEGNTLTPSVISFASGRPVVGGEAKVDQATGVSDVMAFFKSSMGDPAFSCHIAGRDWTATDLSALVLEHLKAQAERALSRPVTQAVVTVPEYLLTRSARRRSKPAAWPVSR